MVWGAWMNPETLPQWWGPEGFSCRTKRIDLRAGGEWVFDMIAPDGTVFPNHHRYSRGPARGKDRLYAAMGREWAETCRRLGLVRGSGRGDEGYAGHGIQHGRPSSRRRRASVLWNWVCKLWASWSASSHPAEVLRLSISLKWACRDGGLLGSASLQTIGRQVARQQSASSFLCRARQLFALESGTSTIC